MSDAQFPESGSGYSSKKRTDQPEVRYVPVEYLDSREQDDEINLLDLIKTIWDGRKTILIATAVFGFIGLFYYIFGPSEYESDAVLIQENQQGVSQQLQLLQNLGGFGGGNRDLSGEVIPASMYPDIIQSAEFQLRVVSHEVEFEEAGFSTTLLDYFENHYDPPVTEKVGGFLFDYTIGLPFTLYRGARSLFSGSNDEVQPEVVEEDGRFLILNSPQRKAISEMRERILIEMSGGLITVKTRLPDAKAAAELNHYVIDLIQEYVIDYRIEKASQNLKFIEDQVTEAKSRYDEAHRNLAEFRDRNVSIATASARTQQEELQNQRDIRFNVYNSLAQQVEQARIKLQEETPVFNVLQRPSVPSSASGGSKLLLILSLIVGVVFGIAWIFGRNVAAVMKQHLRE